MGKLLQSEKFFLHQEEENGGEETRKKNANDGT
jgi:hypothetical protein